jgi:shikimate kinase
VSAGAGKPVALVGFMGSGKTSVGKALARILGLELIDLDAEIEECEGAAIADIFRTRGEPYFREREREALERAAAAQRPRVICTGGGVVLDPRNAELLMRRCVSVWLRASPETVYGRVKSEGTRPILNGGMTVENIASILERRLPFYEAAAHFAVDTDGRSVEEIAREIADKLSDVA